MRNNYIVLFLLGVLVSSTSFATETNLVRLATTTSTKSSGLLEILIPAFEKTSGYKIEVTVVGTGRALRLGRFGEVDVVLVHAPEAESEFVKKGWGVERRAVMKNDFVLVGPASDPAGVKGMKSAGEALKKIALSKSMFASRGDDSGTHKKELRCWAKTGIEPVGSWYYESGGSMGDTLKLASEKGFYTLVDRGTWLSKRNQSPLKLLVEGDPDLENRYGVINVNPARHPKVNYKGASVFSDWLLSSEGQQVVLSLKIDGEQLFFLPGKSN